MATLLSSPPSSRRSLTPWIAGIIAAWGAGVALAANAGLLVQVPPRMVAVTVLSGIILPTLAYFLVPSVKQWVEDFGLRRLTLFHSWRIAAALLFFSYGAQDLLPPQFVENAGLGDLIAGVLALVVVAMPMARWRYWGMHIFGMGDFILAVGTGLYFTLNDPTSMIQIRLLPLALIPMYGVALSGATHLMAFDLLRRRAGGSA